MHAEIKHKNTTITVQWQQKARVNEKQLKQMCYLQAEQRHFEPLQDWIRLLKCENYFQS
jgi:hypothetical protein